MPKKTNFSANGNNYYRTTATIGKGADGKPLRKQFYGTSKKEADTKREEFMAGLRQGLSVDYQKNTFGKSFEHWLEHVHRYKIALPTLDKYQRFHRLYIADCGLVGMRLIDIRSANVQAYYNSLLDKTTAKNIHQIHKLLKIFFNYCVKSDILIKSPLLAVVLPKVPMKTESTNTALMDDDIGKLVVSAKDDIKYFPFVFACFTGLRGGELLALTYKDLDFKEGMINVNKSVRYMKVDGEYKPLLSDTKTEASIRRVPVMDAIQGLLQAHIRHILGGANIIPLGDFLLFPSATGTYREQNNFRQAYQLLCDKLGIEKGRTIHSLRHTFCTILARQGVSLLDASRLMGHSNINITAKIYSHVSENEKKSAIQKLSAYFN